MLGISRIKSPITINMPAFNRPLEQEELRQARIAPATLGPTAEATSPAAPAHGARFDDFSDLAEQEVTVLVCLSGGGARATRMAAHTMAFLEAAYNDLPAHGARKPPLIERIDGWSTVSGGSIYSSYVAGFLLQNRPADTAFDYLANAQRVRWATQRLGALAALYYFWPGNLGRAPVMQLLTEWDTLNLFARTHAMLQEGRMPILPTSTLRKLGELRARPRFFFNATCLEIGRPLVFTQAIIHRNLSADPLSRLGEDPLVYWARGEPVNEASPAEPLRYAATLEDLGSSPARFPVALSVFGSAAFPGVFQPLLLTKYRLLTNAPPPKGPSHKPRSWERQGLVTVVDGGIYDNTGVTTALELLAYLRSRHPTNQPARKFVVLSVDAGVEPDHYEGPRPAARLPWHVDLPVRGLVPAASTFSRLYTKQQSLVRAALESRVKTLVQTGVLDWYEVKLLDAVRNAERIRKIPTDFVLTDAEDHLLKQAVAELLSRPQPGVPGKTQAAAFVEALATASALPARTTP
jgi:hypothetical protein